MFTINSAVNWFQTIVALICIHYCMPSKSQVSYCEEKAVAQHIFSMNDIIYLIREKNVWIAGQSGQPGRSANVEDKFKNLGIHQLMAGFMVSKTRQPCSTTEESSKRRCIFNAFMLDTGFIFYKKSPDSLQVFSMIKFNPKEFDYTFYKNIGGFDFRLRANQSVFESSYGLSHEFNPKIEVISVIFDEDNYRIILFTKEKGKTGIRVAVKQLDENWNSETPFKELPADVNTGSFVGAFKRVKGDGKYFYLEPSGKVVKINKFDPWQIDRSMTIEEKRFFECPNN